MILPLFVSIWFQVLFHSPSGVLFTFPSRYLFTIGHSGVFSLGRWSSLLLTRFLVSRDTLDITGFFYITPTGLLPSSAGLSSPFDSVENLSHLKATAFKCIILNPLKATTVVLHSKCLDFSRFARRY